MHATATSHSHRLQILDQPKTFLADCLLDEPTSPPSPGRGVDDLSDPAHPAAPSSGLNYRPDLPTTALVAEIRALLERQRLLERLICRYLADLADRIAERHADDPFEGYPFGGYRDVYEAAGHLFGFDVRRTRERVRVGRALRGLPRIEHAFDRGEMSYTRVREITRVARPESEGIWLELGMTLPTRQLERRVIAAGGPLRDVDPGKTRNPKSCPFEHGGTAVPYSEPARTMTPEPRPPETVRVVFDLPVEGWLVVQRALQMARDRTEHTLTDTEALIALARAVTVPCEGKGNGSAVDATPACSVRGEATPAGSRAVVRDGASPATVREGATASGRVRGEVTPAGSRSPVPNGATVALPDEATSPPRSGLSESAPHAVDEAAFHTDAILRQMVSRRRWHPDQLCEATGLSAAVVNRVLAMLQLQRTVRWDLSGYHLPFAA